MNSNKQYRDQTPYEVPEHIQKRVKMRNERVDMEYSVAAEIRDDIIHYIQLHPDDVDSIYHTFLRFKNYITRSYLVNFTNAILEPVNMMLRIPIKCGTAPFMSFIQLIRLLYNMQFFDGIIRCYKESKLTNLLSLCTNEGFEILFDEIIKLLYTKRE